MSPLTTKLKPDRAKAPPAAAALFLPGASPASWIESLLTLTSPESARLYPVPSALGTTTPTGLLVVPSTCPNIPTHSIPLARLGDTALYYPASSHFDPPLEPRDIAATLTETHTYFFHPSAGLIAFPNSEALGLHDLTDPRTGSAPLSNWSKARVGESPNTQLKQIRVSLDSPDPIEQILEAGDDIGDRQLKGLPKPKRRDRTGTGIAASLGQSGISGLAGFVKWITGLAPTDPYKTNRTLIDRLSDWADRKSADLSKRNRELNRLLDLLKDNPDEGLRYALPFGGGQRDRGLASPGDTLGRRDTNFDLKALGGGQRADHWEVPWEIQQKLTASYREAALRESRLGRHLRAAYIYAQLLDDLPAAAAVLRTGRHFREAAHLYRDKLNNPKLAAECFREAGLFEEAITIYRERKEHLVLGDLLRELGRENEAIDSYRDAVADHLTDDHPLEAADVIAQKIGDQIESLSILRAAWPDSTQADRCLQREIDLVTPKDPDSARRRLLSLREIKTPPHLTPKLARILADLSIKSQHATLRTFAADETRRVVGLALTDQQVTDKGALISAVAATARTDRLLPRDAARFQKTVEAAPKPTSPFRGKLEDATVELGLPHRVTPTPILAAQPSDTGIFLWSQQEPGSLLTFAAHSQDIVRFPIPQAVSSIPSIIPSERGTIFATLASGTKFFQDTLNSSDGRRVVAPPNIDTTDGILALTYDEHGHALTLRHHRGEFLVNAHDWSGATVSSTTLEIVPDAFGQMFAAGLPNLLPIIARREQVVLALGDHLIRVFRNRFESKPLPSPALTLTASPHLGALRIVATLEDGNALLFRGDWNWDSPPVYLPETEAPPHFCFERGGNLLIAHARHLIIYDPKRNRTARQHRNLFPESPLALAPSQKVGEFYAITSRGIHKANLRG